MNIHESAENYLETILMLQTRNGSVRSIDIAVELNFTKPSVSRAMKSLREKGHIEVQRGGEIVLTESGLQIAEKIYQRHLTLKEYLMRIGVGEETAAADACKIEHVISEESFSKLRAYVEKQSG